MIARLKRWYARLAGFRMEWDKPLPASMQAEHDAAYGDEHNPDCPLCGVADYGEIPDPPKKNRGRVK